jgi:two-component system phosphate regulon sensor histidine kinase PhoR
VFEAVAQPVSGAGEQLAIVLIRDVTELRRLERVRREFVANVSHELRTPLASIRAVVETLEAGAIDDPAVSGDFLSRIVAEVDRLAALVDELLELARLESGRMPLRRERIGAGDLIRAAAERLRPQTDRAGLELVVDAPAQLPDVSVDRSKIEQVLLNLVHNAIKFTPAGGTVTISGAAGPRQVSIRVDDTGPGIPEEELSRVFERFYKSDRARRTEGTGLGLAIAKHLVQAHGGTIRAERGTAGGAALTFTLPVGGAAFDQP